MNPPRVFTRSELNAFGVPHALPEGSVLHRETFQKVLDPMNCHLVVELIFRAPDDERYWRVYYEEDFEGGDPWHGEGEIPGVEMEPREVKVTKWFPVGA